MAGRPSPTSYFRGQDVDGGDEHDEHGPDIEKSERAKDDCGSKRMFSNPANASLGLKMG